MIVSAKARPISDFAASTSRIQNPFDFDIGTINAMSIRQKA